MPMNVPIVKSRAESVSNILDSSETPLRGLTWLSDGVPTWMLAMSALAKHPGPSRYRAFAARALRTPPTGASPLPRNC